MFAGKLCIEVTSQAKLAFISEELCIGCGICVKVRLMVVVALLFNVSGNFCLKTHGFAFDTLFIEKFRSRYRSSSHEASWIELGKDISSLGLWAWVEHDVYSNSSVLNPSQRQF